MQEGNYKCNLIFSCAASPVPKHGCTRILPLLASKATLSQGNKVLTIFSTCERLCVLSVLPKKIIPPLDTPTQKDPCLQLVTATLEMSGANSSMVQRRNNVIDRRGDVLY